MNTKHSRRQRKYVNAMRQMGDVPWPPRRFKYPPTLAAVPTGGRCQKLVAVEWKRRGRLLGYVRAPQPDPKPCGAPLVLIPYGRRLECPACKFRAKRGRMLDRIEKPPATAEVYARWHARRAKAAVGRIFKRRAGP